MKKRPYFNYSIFELEQLYQETSSNIVLKKILDELKHRSTSKANKLYAKVEKALEEKDQYILPIEPKAKTFKIDLSKKVTNINEKKEVKINLDKQVSITGKEKVNQPNCSSGSKWQDRIFGIIVFALLLSFIYLTLSYKNIIGN